MSDEALRHMIETQEETITNLNLETRRVNEWKRLQYFTELGADSFDGSGIAQYSHMRLAMRNRMPDSPLFAGAAAEEDREAAILPV